MIVPNILLPYLTVLLQASWSRQHGSRNIRETTIILGLYWGYIWGYLGIMEKDMETTGVIGVIG